MFNQIDEILSIVQNIKNILWAYILQGMLCRTIGIWTVGLSAITQDKAKVQL